MVRRAKDKGYDTYRYSLFLIKLADMDNTNKGRVWINEYKKEGSKHPDLRGTINVEGTDYNISMWHYPEREGKKECFSIEVQPKIDEPKQKKSNSKFSFNNDLPF